MGSWTVRAEVAGDGHIQYFEHLTTEECAELVNELISDGIWENIDFWENEEKRRA